MKKIYLLTALAMIMVLAACNNSEESKEIVDNVNHYNKHVNKKVNKISQWLASSQQAQSPGQAYNIEKQKVLPLVNDVKQYVHSVKPKTDPVKKLHKIRLEQINIWSDAIHLRTKALKTLSDASDADDQAKAKETMQKAQQKLQKAQKLAKKHKKELKKVASKYHVKLKQGDKSKNK